MTKKHFQGGGPYSNIKNKSDNLKTFFSLNDHDVLCGRGNGVNNRQGNVEFRNYVDNLRGTYAAARRQDKINIARKVVQLVHSNGGRFLRFKGDVNQEVYIEIGKERAVEKACQALRENCGQKKKEVRQMKRQLAKQAALKAGNPSGSVSKTSKGRSSVLSATKKSKPKPTPTKNAKDKSQKNNGTNKSNSSLWQISRRRSSASGGGQFDDPMEDEEDEVGVFDDAEPPAMDESTESDSMSGSDEDENVADASSYYIRYHQSDHQRKKSSVSQQNGQRPPTHRLMMQRPLPTNTTNQMEPSGWFCDFMNGGTSDVSSPSYQNCWETLFRALVEFKEVHGHCAIPPSPGSPHSGSSKEEREHARLADWASVQRQIFREIQNGRRAATEEEKIRFHRLQALGFVWNYDEWHWNRRYEELVDFQGKKGDDEKKSKEGGSTEGPAKSASGIEDFSKCLALALWVKEQRQLYMEGLQGKIGAMRPERVALLEKIDLDFSWTGEKISKKSDEVKETPDQVKEAPVEVKEAPVEVKEAPVEVKEALDEVKEAPLPAASPSPQVLSVESASKASAGKEASPSIPEEEAIKSKETATSTNSKVPDKGAVFVTQSATVTPETPASKKPNGNAAKPTIAQSSREEKQPAVLAQASGVASSAGSGNEVVPKADAPKKDESTNVAAGPSLSQPGGVA